MFLKHAVILFSGFKLHNTMLNRFNRAQVGVYGRQVLVGHPAKGGVGHNAVKIVMANCRQGRYAFVFMYSSKKLRFCPLPNACFVVRCDVGRAYRAARWHFKRCSARKTVAGQRVALVVLRGVAIGTTTHRYHVFAIGYAIRSGRPFGKGSLLRDGVFDNI